METLALLSFFVAAAVDWLAVSQDNKALEYVAKPAALAALILWASMGASASPWLIAALCLGLLGDVYLMLPADLFAPGLGAFLVGHLAYISDFDATFGWRLLWFVLIGVLTFPIWGRIVGAVKESGLRVAVVIYLAVLIFMTGSAFASGLKLAALGGALFAASDAMLAWERFVRPISWARVPLIVTYHLGQFGLVAALRG
jgi:uncharacterized membrane protein YhhN